MGKHFACINPILEQSCRVGVLIIVTLKMRKLRSKIIKHFAQEVEVRFEPIVLGIYLLQLY